jgi:hypothetical protein
MMTDLLDEIQEDIKQEKISSLVKKILTYFIATSIVIIISISVYLWIKNKENQKIELLSNDFFELSDQEDSTSYLKFKDIFEKNIDQNNITYSAFAGFKAASILISENKTEEALEIYKKIAATKSYNQLITDFAELLYISNKYKLSKDPEITPLDNIINSNSAFKYNASMLKASILLDLNKNEEAKIIFTELSQNPETPSIIKKNTQIILATNWKNHDNK